MGSAHSIRATHFQRPTHEDSEPLPGENGDDHHISITNKMIERLVEDATLSGTARRPKPPPHGDYRDKVYMEKLKCLDDRHSERSRITVDDLHAMANRIELRTSNMVSVEPVCNDCKNKVIECYNNYESVEDTVKCWDTVGEFSKCVSEAAADRLRARTRQEARAHARLSRHVAHAKEYALRDLASTSILD